MRTQGRRGLNKTSQWHPPGICLVPTPQRVQLAHIAHGFPNWVSVQAKAFERRSLHQPIYFFLLACIKAKDGLRKEYGMYTCNVWLSDNAVGRFITILGIQRLYRKDIFFFIY